MEDHQKKAFDFAADTTKQLIGFSTGIIALMVTFSKEIVGSNIEPFKAILAFSWGFFVVSMIFGILTLMALTGTLQSLKKNKNGTLSSEGNNYLSINNWNIRIMSVIQIISFVIGIILTAFFGYCSINEDSPKVKEKPIIIRKSILHMDSTVIYIDTLTINE